MHAHMRRRAEWLELVVRLEESGPTGGEVPVQFGLSANTFESSRARANALEIRIDVIRTDRFPRRR